jgi:hypothetical protein
MKIHEAIHELAKMHPETDVQVTTKTLFVTPSKLEEFDVAALEHEDGCACTLDDTSSTEDDELPPAEGGIALA